MVCLRPSTSHFDSPEAIEEPWIGEVTDIGDDSFSIHWFGGSLSSAWRPLFEGKRKRTGRPYVQEDNPFETVLLYGFRLTSTKRLPAAIARDIRQTMQHIEESLAN